MSNAKFGNTSNKFESTAATAEMMDGDKKDNRYVLTQPIANGNTPEQCFEFIKFKISLSKTSSASRLTPS